MASWGESAAAAPEVVVAGRQEVEEESWVRGRARPVVDPDIRRQVAAAYHAPVPDNHTPFALDMGRVLHAAHRFRGDWPFVYTRWPVPREA